MGNDVEIINTGEKIAKFLEEYLVNSELENSMKRKGVCKYYLTDTECNFIQVAGNLLQDENIKDEIQKVDIE